MTVKTKTLWLRWGDCEDFHIHWTGRTDAWVSTQRADGTSSQSPPFLGDYQAFPTPPKTGQRLISRHRDHRKIIYSK